MEYDELEADEVISIPLRNRAAYEAAKNDFLEAVEKVTIPKILKTTYDADGKIVSAQRDLIIGDIGRTMNFGFLRTRSGYKNAVSNSKYPELFEACVALGNQVVPKGWKYSAITLNHNVKARKHIDGTNVGNSVIVAVGEFTGGGLYVYEPDGKKGRLLNIHNKAKMFNGAVLPHKTQAFKGDRYTLIFFNHKKGAEVEGVRMEGL